MTNLSNKTLLAGVAGAWLLAAVVFVTVRPTSSVVVQANAEASATALAAR
jgi:hypothetical protein